MTACAIDLGGGTFDISAFCGSPAGYLKCWPPVAIRPWAAMISTARLPSGFASRVGMDENLEPVEQRILLETAKSAKEELTDQASVEIEVLDWQGTLSREAQ